MAYGKQPHFMVHFMVHRKKRAPGTLGFASDRALFCMLLIIVCDKHMHLLPGHQVMGWLISSCKLAVLRVGIITDMETG